MKAAALGLRRLIRPVPATPLRAFEVCFTLSFLVLHTWNLTYWRDWLTPEAFHLTPTEVRQLGYPAWFPRLPREWVPMLALALYGCAVGILFNCGRRAALILTAALAIYLQGVDYPATSAQYKICILVYLLLATAPGYVRGARTGVLWVSAAPIRVLQAVIVIIYFAAGWTKCFGEGAWLNHTDTLKLTMQGFHRTEFAAWALRSFPDWLWTVTQWGTVLFEVGAPLWFALRVTRPWALLAGMGMHVGIALTMHNVWPFSLQMIAFYPLFMAHGLDWWWRRLRHCIKTAAH